MSRKLVSLILAVILLIGILPTTVSADVADLQPAKITVYVTISRNGSIVTDQSGRYLALVPVQLAGKASYTIDDALSAAHETCYEGGASAGYSSELGDYGKSLTKLWGDTNSLMFGYQVNGGSVSVWDLDTKVSDGDVVDAYIMQSAYPNSEAYARFDRNTAAVDAGEHLELTLSEAYWDESFSMHFRACEGATVTLNGETTSWTTDENGRVVITPDTSGTIVVSAVKTKTVSDATVTAITAPACVVTLTARCGDVYADGQINAKDVTKLRRSIAGGYSVTIDPSVADINADGLINAKDITALRRYLAGGYGVVLP